MNLQDLQKSLWATADKLRSNMDAAEYKHIVPGLIFLKYISDAFQAHQLYLSARFSNPQDDYYEERPSVRESELEERDYYLRIADTYHAWRGLPLASTSSATGKPLPELVEGSYQDLPGFCKSASRAEIEKHGFVLTPGRYVGAAEVEDDGEPFAEKMERLSGELAEQFAEGARLEAEIKRNLGRLGYEI